MKNKYDIVHIDSNQVFASAKDAMEAKAIINQLSLAMLVGTEEFVTVLRPGAE